MKKRLIFRDGAYFLVNRSDYMQWYILAGLPDNSWKSAASRLEKLRPGHHLHVFDVGANCGAFTLKLAAFCDQKSMRDVTIHAFEPNPKIAEALIGNCELNPNLKTMIKVHQFGLGSSTASMPFYANEENSGAGRFGGSGKDSPDNLMLRKMDDIVSEIEPGDIFFVKIDVEGFEPEVLKGASETILKYMPEIYIEMTDVWFREKGSSCRKILEYFWGMGYQTFLDSGRHFEPISRHNQDKIGSLFQYNLLAQLK